MHRESSEVISKVEPCSLADPLYSAVERYASVAMMMVAAVVVVVAAAAAATAAPPPPPPPAGWFMPASPGPSSYAAWAGGADLGHFGRAGQAHAAAGRLGEAAAAFKTAAKLAPPGGHEAAAALADLGVALWRAGGRPAAAAAALATASAAGNRLAALNHAALLAEAEVEALAADSGDSSWAPWCADNDAAAVTLTRGQHQTCAAAAAAVARLASSSRLPAAAAVELCRQCPGSCGLCVASRPRTSGPLLLLPPPPPLLPLPSTGSAGPDPLYSAGGERRCDLEVRDGSRLTAAEFGRVYVRHLPPQHHACAR